MSVLGRDKNCSIKELEQDFEIFSDCMCLLQGKPNHPNYGLTERAFKKIKQKLFELDKDKANELMRNHLRKVGERWKLIHWRARSFGI
jgi:hypothetical protein